MIILNLMPFNLMSRILFTTSEIFSIFFWILALYEIVKISWNHFHPSQDWGRIRVNNSSFKRWFRKSPYKLIIKNKINKKNIKEWMRENPISFRTVIGLIVIICLVLIFPIFHI